MKHAQDVSEGIIKISDGYKDQRLGLICNDVKDYAIELATICKNIRETSVGDHDRIERMKRLASESGIGLYIIQMLC